MTSDTEFTSVGIILSLANVTRAVSWRGGGAEEFGGGGNPDLSGATPLWILMMVNPKRRQAGALQKKEGRACLNARPPQRDQAGYPESAPPKKL